MQEIVKAIEIIFFHEFLKCLAHHGPIPTLDYPKSNKNHIHNAHFTHLKQSQYYLM